jgi:hypothetical protein
MPKPPRSSAQALVDQLGVLQLIAIAVALTVLPAFGYYWLSGEQSVDGLISPDTNKTISMFDAVYLSVITEATLGYGDIRPIGWSRVIAMVQVIAGLLFAGLCVAKITSIQGRVIRLTFLLAGGDRIEACRMRDGTVMITLSRIYLGGKGLHYDGENYGSDGTPLGIFRGHATEIDLDGEFVAFDYSNKESSTDHFTEGVCTVKYTKDSKTKKWIRHQGTTDDIGTRTKTIYQGFRASVTESDVIHGSNSSALLSLISRYSDKCFPNVEKAVPVRRD